MNSQNWSSVLTLFHCPLLLDGVPPSATILSVPRSGSSSSNSSRNLALGSSGKCGTRHRGGAAGYGAICRSGCVVAQRRGVLGTEGGVYRSVSYDSKPGITRYPFAVDSDCVGVPLVLVPSPSISRSAKGFPSPSALYSHMIGSSTLHHHFTKPLSSRTCLFLFSMLAGNRY